METVRRWHCDTICLFIVKVNPKYTLIKQKDINRRKLSVTNTFVGGQVVCLRFVLLFSIFVQTSTLTSLKTVESDMRILISVINLGLASVSLIEPRRDKTNKIK